MNAPNPIDKLTQLEKENLRLRRAVEELSILNEISTAISSVLSLNKIIELMVQKCVKHLGVEQAAVMMLDSAQSDNPFQTMVRQADSTHNILPYRLDTQLTGWMLKHQKPLLVNNLQTDERFKNLVEKDFPIQSLLSVPLVAKGEMIGIITVFNKKSPEGFSQDDRRLLTIIATQSTQIIENARLLEEQQALIRMREEMRMAQEIQLDLLPHSPPQLSGYDLAGISIPAKEVGGDYFDYIQLDEHRLALCLGDVTGKGLPAALLMANLQATIRSQAMMTGPPKDCMGYSNTLLHQRTSTGKFVTMFYGVLNVRDHSLTFCNAGHDNPFLCQGSSGGRRLETGGVVLGFVPQYVYKEERIELQAGDCLVVYSDGITEAKNEADEEFGDERLEKLIRNSSELSAAALIDKIVAAVQKHAENTPQADDMTLVIAKRL